MDNVKNDVYYIRKIVTDLQFILDHTNGITKDEFKSNEVLLDSVMFRLIQVSENSSRLTDAFKAIYNEIPWTAIKGMRNRIVHEYGEVDLTVIYDTVTGDLADIVDILSALV